LFIYLFADNDECSCSSLPARFSSLLKQAKANKKRVGNEKVSCKSSFHSVFLLAENKNFSSSSRLQGICLLFLLHFNDITKEKRGKCLFGAKVFQETSSSTSSSC
jgi:hypothetical protein